MMSKVEIKVERPVDFAPALWAVLNTKLMKLLVEVHEIDPADDETCNWRFHEFLSPRQIADMAVMVFGNDLPYTLKVVSNLRIIGNGDCPECGSNTRWDITGGANHEETYGTCFEVIGYRCKNCQHIDYR